MIDSSDPAAAGPMPYENIADATLAKQAFTLYRRGELQVQAFNNDGVVSAQVWGPCPRCGHALNIQQVITTPVVDAGGRGLLDALRRRKNPTTPPTVDVGCDCQELHPGAPEPVHGCGASFRLPTGRPTGSDAAAEPS
jgi:hypothetical protein